MTRSPLCLLVITLLALPASVRTASAAWPHEPYNGNVPVCASIGSQFSPVSVSDGSGGMLLTWMDDRDGVNVRLHAQRIDATGVARWAADGVLVCAAAGSQTSPTITSDGAGGAIITWQDIRDGLQYDVYAQRLGADGSPQWTADGVVVCAGADNQLSPAIVSDGAGGAIVSWDDFRVGVFDIYAQRLNADGVPQWTGDGVLLCASPGDQQATTIVTDNARGAIVCWRDYRGGPNSDLYMQRISAAGVPLWPANGAPLCTAVNFQESPSLASDGSGGALAVWMDFRNGASYDIYAQHMSATGFGYWATDGLALCAAAGSQYTPVIAADGSGGGVVAWSDSRGSSADIYVQRISGTGVPQWTANGVSICSAQGAQGSPVIVPAGAGSMVIAWADERGGTYIPDIYAQRITAAGVAQWTAQGAALCTSLNGQSTPTMVSDGASGAIVGWQDFRTNGNGGTADLYAQRIEQFGKLGSPEPVIASVLDTPNDQGGRVRLAWEASYLDRENDSDLTAYDVFHSVPPNLAREAIARGESRSLRPGDVPVEGEGAHLFTGFGAQQLAWEYASTVNAQHFLATYGSTQGTNGDSVAGSNPTTSFMVVGRNGNGSKYWLSAFAEGYSVDNLAPAAPAPLTGQYGAGTANLYWNPNAEPDVAGYRLYRGTGTAFVPGPGNLLATLSQTIYADVAGSPYVYKLTAIDTHGNESLISTLVLGGTLGVDGASQQVLSFAAPNPNPARGETMLRYALSRAGHVRLAVYDAAGRRVQVLRDGGMPAGAHEQRVKLRDDAGRALASGLYLVRLEAEGRVITRRLATIR